MNSGNKTVDVIIVNWNGLLHLSGCIGSLTNQTYRNRNILVVDNNSTDGSIEYLQKYYKDQIQIVHLDDNYGFAAANNRAMMSVRGEYIALINNDAVAHPDWLSESIACLEAHPQAGMCASKIVNYYRRSIVDTAGDNYTRGGINSKRGSGKSEALYDDFGYVFGACAAAVVLRREMVEDIGYFDEDFFIMCEDVDLNLRAQLAGYKCIYCPKAIVYHKVHATIKGYPEVFSYYGQRNIEYVYFKDLPLGIMIGNLPFHILYNITVFLLFLSRKELGLFFMAKWDFLIDIRSIYSKRRKVQRTRRVTNSYLNSIMTKGWFREKLKMRMALLRESDVDDEASTDPDILGRICIHK